MSKATLGEVIWHVESYLHQFAQTSAFDSGRRLSEVEAYLCGLEDARRLVNRALKEMEKVK